MVSVGGDQSLVKLRHQENVSQGLEMDQSGSLLGKKILDS